MTNKPTRIYLKPHRLKRGHKLAELPHDTTSSDCWNWIKNNMTFRYGGNTLFRSWCKDGKTIIDYGSYSSYIVINKTFKGEN